MASDTTTPERMSAERLQGLREKQNPHGTFGSIIHELLAHIAAVEAELEAARATALDDAAKVAQVQLDRWTRHAERATKRANSEALLKAAGYQGEPELEQIEAESFRDMAGTILDGIRALKEG